MFKVMKANQASYIVCYGQTFSQQRLSCKESAYNAGDLGSIPGLGRSPREGKGYPLQYSGLENSMDYSMGLQRVGYD